MKNKNLEFDLERLLSYDEYSYTDISTDYDEDLGYILDIKDSSYFYINCKDRDEDDSKFMNLIENKL